jgi:hypothetical protein
MGRDWNCHNMNNTDITLLVCNYNTPELVVNLLRSVKQHCIELPKVVVMNTSTTSSSELLDENEIPYFNYRGGIHGEAVNLGLRKVKTRYVLLVDSDLIILQDFAKAFERFKASNFSLMGKVVGDCGGKKLYSRVEPWFCFIDVEKLKRRKIDFFDRVRHNERHIRDVERIYDVGSTMFEDCSNAGETIGDVNLENRYFKHYGGMSWREQKYDPNQEDTDIDFGGTHPHKGLYDIAQVIKQNYFEEAKALEGVDIKGIFK